VAFEFGKFSQSFPSRSFRHESESGHFEAYFGEVACRCGPLLFRWIYTKVVHVVLVSGCIVKGGLENSSLCLCVKLSRVAK
jgi:hypothetical protein